MNLEFPILLIDVLINWRIITFQFLVKFNAWIQFAWKSECCLNRHERGLLFPCIPASLEVWMLLNRHEPHRVEIHRKENFPSDLSCDFHKGCLRVLPGRSPARRQRWTPVRAKQIVSCRRYRKSTVRPKAILKKMRSCFSMLSVRRKNPNARNAILNSRAHNARENLTAGFISPISGEQTC